MEATTKVDVHIEVAALRDDGGVEQGAGGEFVPKAIAFGGVFRDVLRGWTCYEREMAFSISSVKMALMETSTAVASMRGQCARRTMWAASGSNQKLNSGARCRRIRGRRFGD